MTVDITQLLSFVARDGFAIAVAAFLLVRLDQRLLQMTTVLTQIQDLLAKQMPPKAPESS